MNYDNSKTKSNKALNWKSLFLEANCEGKNQQVYTYIGVISQVIEQVGLVYRVGDRIDLGEACSI